MSPKRRRATNAEEQRAKVLKAAGYVFGKKGYEGATLDLVAKHANATKTIVYYYFKSKSDLFFQLIDTTMSRLEQYMDDVLNSELEPEQQLRLMIKNHCKLVCEHKWDTRAIMFHQALRLLPRTRRTQLAKRGKDYEARFCNVIERGIAMGQIRNIGEPKIVVKLLLSALNSIAAWYRPSRLGSDEFSDLIVEIIVDNFLCAKPQTANVVTAADTRPKTT